MVEGPTVSLAFMEDGSQPLEAWKLKAGPSGRGV